MSSVREALTFIDLRCRAIRQHAALVFIILMVGTGVYSVLEDMPPTQAAYFSVITLSTVGYGDISPKTQGGQVFTAFYLLSGVTVHLSFASALIAHRNMHCGCHRGKEEQRADEQEAEDRVLSVDGVADGGGYHPDLPARNGAVDATGAR